MKAVLQRRVVHEVKTEKANCGGPLEGREELGSHALVKQGQIKTFTGNKRKETSLGDHLNMKMSMTF